MRDDVPSERSLLSNAAHPTVERLLEIDDMHCPYRGTSLIRTPPPPYDPPITLGRGLR